MEYEWRNIDPVIEGVLEVIAVQGDEPTIFIVNWPNHTTARHQHETRPVPDIVKV